MNMNICKAKRTGNRAGDMANLMNVTLMMVILAFFIVLNAISVPVDSKKKKALGSLTGSLGLLPGGLSAMSPIGSHRSLTPGPIMNKELTHASLLGKFEQYLINEKFGDKTSSMMGKGGVVLSLQNKILFSPGSAELTPKGLGIVKELAKFLSRIKGELLVEGYLSDRKIKSARYPSSFDLSNARAGALVRSLIRDGWKNKGKIAIAGYGDARPLVPNDSEKNRDKNDRMRIIYKIAL